MEAQNGAVEAQNGAMEDQNGAAEAQKGVIEAQRWRLKNGAVEAQKWSRTGPVDKWTQIRIILMRSRFSDPDPDRIKVRVGFR